MPRKKAPELTFQQRLADFLVRRHGYGVLEQGEITDIEHCIAEDHLWAFLTDTQPETLKKLATDYGRDARDEVFRALRSELQRQTPLWLLLRHGLQVRGLEFRLYYPKPRSSESVASTLYDKNRITFRPHFYFGDQNQEIDFVLFLNGLPIVALELKHEKNQNVHNAVAQFTARDHACKIFQHPFLYLAANTSDVMAATDPRREENFRWHNTGLTNMPQTAGEYPVEFLYREVLSKEQLLEALAFFLVYVPQREAEDDRPERPACTLFPRYHQSRMVRKVADAAGERFAATGEVGGKYLINHSAGSGKTLSICWLADRLHSLYRPGTNEKLVDMVFVLTDRKSLDKNIRDEIENFTHLKNVVGLARKAEDLPRFLKERKSIIVTTQQKFASILEEIESDAELKTRRVAFLIDEAHRSQEGKMAVAIRVPFRKADDPDVEDAEEDTPDDEEQIAKIIREHDRNQLFVAFTATPAPATVTLFGEPFDTYAEAEAIAEGYIVDVAASLISYKTLYHLHCPVVPKPDEEKLYKASVQYQGEVRSGGPVKLKPGKGRKGAGPPPKKVSVHEMIAQIRAQFDITDEEALYIKEVTEEKVKDPAIHATVQVHKEDTVYLDGPYQVQVNGEIQTAYEERGRYEELADPKYTGTGAIFDIMAFTVIRQNLYESPAA